MTGRNALGSIWEAISRMQPVERLQIADEAARSFAVRLRVGLIRETNPIAARFDAFRRTDTGG